jgi:voltage-gated potassium channel Kch
MEEKKYLSIDDLDVKALVGAADVKANISSDLPLRKWLYAWTMDPNIEGNYQKFIDKWISILIVANLFALLFEHVPGIFEPNAHLFHYFDVFSVVVFTLEYFLRFYVAPEDPDFAAKRNARTSYVFSPFAIIDLLAIAPFYLQFLGIPMDLRFLRFLRLLRILKLFRILIPAYQAFAKANVGRTLRQKVHALVFPGTYGGRLQELFDGFIAVCVLLSVFAVVMETVHSVNYMLHLQFVIMDAVLVGIFTLEYVARMYSCVEEPGFKSPVAGRFKQATTLSTFIDLLAILPFFLEALLHHLFDLRFLRVFRLARLLKLTRGNDATATLVKVLSREWPVISASGFIMILLVVLTAALGYLFENAAQPDKYEDIPTTIYWAVITLASIGYGDIYPVTPVGRAMTVVMAFAGIGIFAIPAAILASAFSDELVKQRNLLKANLHDIMADGVISADELEYIRGEAKRLHLSVEEVNALIRQIHKEVEEKSNLAALPIHKIAAKPELAAEHYKTLISNIRQLGMLMDPAEFEQMRQTNSRLTPDEIALWEKIRA